ncbi:YncE family protein [Halalkalibacillus halophilus]|uniref:YncE family protein n=1 Tax=Halalkalibacillus halophilus TaxID=392827 RepID=UPI000425AC02|nr:YncE family protein [Halalkalibacillus halophilus]
MENYLIVLNKDEDTISIVDLAQEKTIKTIATSHNPHEVIVTKDNKKAYIACSLGNKLDVLDIETFEITNTIEHPEFEFPHGVDLTKDGKKLYLASTFSSKIFIINTETDEIEKIIPTHQNHSHMIAFSPNGKTVYIPNIGSHNVTEFDVEKEKVVTHFPVGRGPEGLAVHPDGKHIYVANQEDNTLYVIDQENYETLFKRRIGDLPVRLVFSPDGKYALIANRHSHDVSVIQTDQYVNNQTRPWEIKRIPVGRWAGGIVFNSKGTQAYVANNKTNDISVLDMSTLKEVSRIEVGIHPDGIAYLQK